MLPVPLTNSTIIGISPRVIFVINCFWNRNGKEVNRSIELWRTRFVLFNKWTEHWNRERPLSVRMWLVGAHSSRYPRNVPFSWGVSLSSKRYDTLMVLLHDHRLVRDETNVRTTSSRRRALNFSASRSTWPAIRRPNAVFIHLLKFVETSRSESFLWVTLCVFHSDIITHGGHVKYVRFARPLAGVFVGYFISHTLSESCESFGMNSRNYSQTKPLKFFAVTAVMISLN